jgi:parvulin-like peptidyl-prolyl isomerase
LLIVGISPGWSQSVADGIAAVVNDSVITFSEVRREVEPTERQYREIFSGVELVEKIKEARLSALKALIERELIIQDFKGKGFFIPDNIVEEKIQGIIRSSYDGDRNLFIRTLQERGISMANFREDVRNQIIVGAMRSRNVASAVLVSPYKIEQYYQDNIRQFAVPTQAKVRAIYMKVGIFKETRTRADGTEEEFDPNLVQMEEILQKVETGSDFANLAQSYSEAPQRSAGGDMGWVSETSLRKELADIVFKMRPGEISPIITLPEGYYIMMVEDVRKSTVISLNDVREQVENTLLLEEREKLQQQWLDSLRAKAFIKMFF